MIHPLTCTDYCGNRFTICFILSLLIVLWSAPRGATAQNPYETGKKWFQQRSAEADSFRAQPAYINKALESFEEARKKEINPEETATFLLRSYYFKGMFLGLPEERQKELYDRGKKLGEEMMERFPRSVPIKFWYGANVGRWADVHGFVAAATNGISKKLRAVCEEIISLDADYQGGGGYRILAQVHFHSPNIPLVMGWPSDQKALELVEKAVNIAPEHPTNLLLYAQLLLEFDRGEEARNQLKTILNLEPRPDNLVEDRYVQYRARQLLEGSL
ncbi:tetratricopeptide repeat protein [Halalkalibaculum sp. DA3122]|uniref:tetratricopeptide repeat protein n=1 Tax=Halalkalibaculum sp. DA3122 TaxID=3373607 RepID=UPI0037552411